MDDLQLIAEVAEKVMGWKYDEHGRLLDARGNYISQWNPISDLNHAGEVIKAVGKEYDWFMEVQYTDGTFRHYVSLYPRDATMISGASAEIEDIELGRAVCLAALEAMGVEQEQPATG